jgi:hypothetical protein
MGREARCLVRHGGDEAEAKVLLETDEVIVRSPFRLSVRRDQITAARADGGRLAVEWPEGLLEIDLGEREAARWAHEIAHPKTVADKLGVKPGQRVLLVGEVDEELLGAGERIETGPADVAFLRVETPADLDRIGSLQEEIERDGAIWAIRPKGRPDLTEAMVIAAGRAAGLKDIKIARISETQTAMKFVIPLERR